MAEDSLRECNATLPKHDGLGRDGRGSRNKRGELNSSRETGGPRSKYHSHELKRGSKQGIDQIYHGGLNAGVAIRTCGAV